MEHPDTILPTLLYLDQMKIIKLFLHLLISEHFVLWICNFRIISLGERNCTIWQ